MWTPRPGDFVSTPLGSGQIQAIQGFRTQVNVKITDDTSVLLWFETAELQALNHKEFQQEVAVTAERLNHFNSPHPYITHRRTIEALRFGLVPPQGLEELTVGFDRFEQWVLSHLPHSHDGHPQISEVCGPFGTGKSHAMAVVRHIAHREGYLTASVEVNGNSITLANPKGLLFHLFNSLSGPGLHSSTPLVDLYIKAIERGHSAPVIAPRGIDRIQDNYATVLMLKQRGLIDKYGYSVDAILSCSDEFTTSHVAQEIRRDPSVYSYEVSLRPILGQRRGDRPYDFVEALAGTAVVAQLAGYKGLVIAIDEFEVERRWAYQRVGELIDVLTKYLTGKLDHRPAPLAFFFATVGEGGGGDQIVDDMITAAGSDYWLLHPLGPNERLHLARKIHAMYTEAYSVDTPFDPDVVVEVEEKLEETMGGDVGGEIRAFVKTYVAELDALYGPPYEGGDRSHGWSGVGERSSD